MILHRRSTESGLAIPIVIAVIVIMGIAAISVSLLLRQGTRQITTIVDETVLLNVAEAILDKVVCSLKKESWGDRWYKETKRHAFGGTGSTSSDDESGVYINDRRVPDERYLLARDEALLGRFFVVRKGKKDNVLVRIAGE